MNRVSDAVIMRAQQGDSCAFEEIYKAYYNYAFYYALKLTKNEAEAKDITQDAFMQVHRYIKDLRQPEYFNLWLARIVQSKCSHYFRKHREVTIEDQDLQYYLDNSEDAKREHQRSKLTDDDVLRKLIAQLSSKQAEVLTLMYFHQLTITEMAIQLNCPEGTVKSRLAQAKKMLAVKVKEFEKSENRQLCFRTDVLSTGILFVLLSKCKVFFQQSLASQSLVVASAVSMVVVSTVAVAETTNYIEAKGEPTEVKQSSFQPIVYEEETITNAKEAYYSLLNWTTSENTSETKKDIEVIFKALKQTSNEYFILLEQNQTWKSKYYQ